MTTVAYYEGKGADPVNHRLDLFRPDGHAGTPVLLFFHGGVWQRGDKREYGNIGEAFARRGILTAIVNYRLTPSVRHPGHVQDAARAVAWAMHHAGEYGGRADRIFLSGHSAGGHLVTLLLFDPQYLRAEAVDPERLAGVIALSGVFDLTMPIDDTSEGGFAQFIYPPFGRAPKALEAASPIRHLHPTRVPLLIVVAGEDYRDMRAQSKGFADAVGRVGIAARFETVSGRGHFQLVQAIGTAGDPTTDLVTRFVSTPAAP
ncbi:MAG TPA: alpha/beta hydrolase [bacterium]|nr:alpha/beta hydrolase [bacterium]